MKKLKFSIIVCLCCIISTVDSAEGLPAKPWKAKAPTPNDGMFRDAEVSTDLTKAPVYSTNQDGGAIVAVDPWARARDRSNVRTWRGSGQHGKLNYIGEATTFDSSANGQELLAPEVNRHNMVVMLDHLRNMGYKIPKSYDNSISDMPSKYRAAWQRNYDAIHSSSNPFSRTLVDMMGIFENQTGLDVHNLITNTMDILGTD